MSIPILAVHCIPGGKTSELATELCNHVSVPVIILGLIVSSRDMKSSTLILMLRKLTSNTATPPSVETAFDQNAS